MQEVDPMGWKLMALDQRKIAMPLRMTILPADYFRGLWVHCLHSVHWHQLPLTRKSGAMSLYSVDMELALLVVP
jgi:hypothetical protein